MINSLLNRKTKSTNVSKLIDCDGNTTCTSNEIADSFNKYFSNIASDLKQKSSEGGQQNNEDHNFYEEYLKNPVSETIF